MRSAVNGVFLLGLRGSGKTTLGRCLAERLVMAFLDTDLLLERRTGRSPAEILEVDGEAALRTQERDLLTSIGPQLRRGGLVLALGGGSTDSPDVERLLQELRARHRWCGVWLLVDLDRLAARQRASAVPRPRLAGGSLEEEIRILAARRAALYARLADVRFDNSPPDVAEQARLLAARLTDRPAPA